MPFRAVLLAEARKEKGDGWRQSLKVMEHNSPMSSDEAEFVAESELLEIEHPAHNPCAPVHEVFDISTTVDPSYIISLIRKLLPIKTSNQSEGIHVHDQENGRTVVSDDRLQREPEDLTSSGREATWEEHGCTLWDLAANETHAELMVQNLILEVILANLMVTQSVRTMEISLGIMGNLACHDISKKQMASTNGLIDAVINTLFIDDTRCLCEAFRLLTLCLQGGERIIWSEALSSEHILSRVLWVVENTLNPELIEKSLGFLTILGNQQDVASILLPHLMKLGLPDLLFNQFVFGMSKLAEEGMSERYSFLDSILQAIDALSASDDFSSLLCSNKKFVDHLVDLIKIPEKIEVVDSCVTAAVLVANIITDVEHLAHTLSQDMDFLQSIFDIVPLASDDIEAKSALWSILARLLNCIEASELNPSSACQFISIIAGYSGMIEEELLNLQLDAAHNSKSFTSNAEDLSASSRILRCIFKVLRQWKLLKAQASKFSTVKEELVSKGDVDKLLALCSKSMKC